jgi:SNF2 family DNA or RNA helicase
MPSVSDDLVDLGEVAAFDIDIRALLEGAKVSGDLFVPLGRARSDGRKYGRTGEVDGDGQSTLPFNAPTSRDKDGFRKSFTEITARSGATRRTMTIWDLILPLLEAPLSLDFPRFFDLPSPLYPYQVDGVHFLVRSEGALLGDDMGTGKTVQTIVALRVLFQSGRIASALIVVPLALLKSWDRELQRWAPTLSGVTVVRGPAPQREIQWEKAAHIWIATYGTVRSDIDHICKKHHFDVVVLDEIQAIKNPRVAQSQAAKQLPRRISWGLSGTPIENALDDLVSIYDFLKPGLLSEGVSPQQAKAAIRDHFLRRRKQDVLQDLPDKKAFDLWLALDEEQRAAYDAAEREGRVWLESLGGEITVQHVLALLQRLKMLCNRDPKSAKSAKLEVLEEKLEEATSEGSKCLAFSQYKAEGVDLIVKRFAQYKPARLTGDATGAQRDKAVQSFQTDDQCRLLVATPKAGGVGLNLVAANYVFHFDHWWNPATVQQATDRVHRIGQTKEVFVYHLWTEGTVEERIYALLERKQKLYDDVIDDLSNVESSGLSEDELFGLFGLKSPRQRQEAAANSGSGDGTLDRLLAMAPQDFEAAVALLYEELGFGTRVTPPSRDGGVDIVASRSTTGGGSEKYAIQCKRYDRQRNVGSPEVRELLGFLARDRSFTKGVLVTTSDFTPDCRKFVEGQGNLELINGSRLVRLIAQANMSLS